MKSQSPSLMSRRKSNPESEECGEPSFEEALCTLEAIVEKMENEQLPLEELVTQYEHGSALLNRCEAVLLAAKGRIELITLRNQGQSAPEPSASAAETNFHLPVGSPDDSDADENDIRLF